jgi:protein SMG6
MCLLILIFQEQAHVVLRIRKIVFFGTVFLCGVDPPVLKLQKFDSGFSEYVSVVQSSSQGLPSSLHEEDQVSIFLCHSWCD